jgi:hypothetical protein
MTIERFTTGDFIASLPFRCSDRSRAMCPIYFDAKCAHSVAARVPESMHAKNLGKLKSHCVAAFDCASQGATANRDAAKSELRGCREILVRELRVNLA